MNRTTPRNNSLHEVFGVSVNTNKQQIFSETPWRHNMARC